MKAISIYNKLDHFLSLLKGKNFSTNNESTSDKKDNKFIQFDFKVKYFLIFDKNGLLLANTAISEYTKLSIKVIDKLKVITMKLVYLNIKNFETNYKHLKIYFLNDNFVYICITSNKVNACLIRLYLYFLNTVFLNLIGDNVKNSNCLINISKIFEVYFVSALTSKFNKVMEYILSNKEKNSCNYLYKFKSLFIYYCQRNVVIPIFDYRKIVYRKELQYKYSIRNKEKLFNTINKLIIEPLYKNNFITQNEIYSHELELYATFPRWMIFGKYFKIYNGLRIVEVFSAKKLSKITPTYKEFQIKKQTSIKDYNTVASKHSRKFIKLIELFTFNYLETIDKFVSKHNNPQNELLYFDIDLLIVINDVISLKLTEDGLISLIYKRLQLFLINKIKLGDHNHSILLEENNENSNSNSNDIINKENDDKYNEGDYEDDEDSEYTAATVSKSFLQIESSEIFEDIYHKRKSLQLSFESNEQMFNTSEINETFQNISYIRNLNNNTNYDAYSLLSYKPNDSKKIGSGIDLFSLFDKKEDSLNLSRLPTEKQMNVFRDHRNSIGPTFNIIVNNNKGTKISKNTKLLSKRVSFMSLKDQNNIFFDTRKKSIFNNSNNLLTNNKQKDFKKRSYSFTESGLFLRQFYTLMSNSKYFKNKHQILKEIQNKISSMKRNNSLKDLQAEFKLKNNSPFYKYSLKNGKGNEEEKTNIEKSNENKASEHNIHIIKNSLSIEENEDSLQNNEDNGGEIMNEFYGDKSSFNFIQDKENDVFKKLNNKKY